jgi:hypothetical protein
VFRYDASRLPGAHTDVPARWLSCVLPDLGPTLARRLTGGLLRGGLAVAAVEGRRSAAVRVCNAHKQPRQCRHRGGALHILPAQARLVDTRRYCSRLGGGGRRRRSPVSSRDSGGLGRSECSAHSAANRHGHPPRPGAVCGPPRERRAYLRRLRLSGVQCISSGSDLVPVPPPRQLANTAPDESRAEPFQA